MPSSPPALLMTDCNFNVDVCWRWKRSHDHSSVCSSCNSALQGPARETLCINLMTAKEGQNFFITWILLLVISWVWISQQRPMGQHQPHLVISQLNWKEGIFHRWGYYFTQHSVEWLSARSNSSNLPLPSVRQPSSKIFGMDVWNMS